MIGRINEYSQTHKHRGTGVDATLLIVIYLIMCVLSYLV